MLLLWSLCLLWGCSVAHKCQFNYDRLTVPSVLDSLKCYNNYRSYFHCTWTEPKQNSTGRLQLFFHKSKKTHECKDYPSDGEGIRACKFKTDVFSPGTKYTVFFDYPHGLCSSNQTTRQSLSLLRPEQPPLVTFVQQEVQGKQETWCSWEQSIGLGHFISYHLVCHHNHMVTPNCCTDLKVTTEHMKDTAKFSCRVALTPSSNVELVPKRNAKWLKAMDNVRPDPPTGLSVTKKGQIYVVNWTKPEIRDFTLNYEVRYYSQQNEEDAKTISRKESTYNIKWSSLQPSCTYRVKVRALVTEGGTPSEWSLPKEWTVDAATWQNWIYASVALVVSALFIKLLVLPTCKRRVVLWVESVPSPEKSKAVLDIKTVENPKLMMSEETYRCKVMDMDSVSTCYSVTSIWPNKRLDSQMEDTEDEGVWSFDNLPIAPLDKSSLSFSGPYILCPPVESKQTEKPAEVSWPSVGCPIVVTSQTEEGYVRLPCPTVSTSMEHLPSQNHSSADDGQSSWDTEEVDQHPLTQDCTFEAFWPQEGAILGSGYCQLPSDFTLR